MRVVAENYEQTDTHIHAHTRHNYCNHRCAHARRGLTTHVYLNINSTIQLICSVLTVNTEQRTHSIRHPAETLPNCKHSSTNPINHKGERDYTRTQTAAVDQLVENWKCRVGCGTLADYSVRKEFKWRRRLISRLPYTDK